VGVFERATAIKTGGNSRSAKGVIADRRRNADVSCAPLN
jgi:hypothetical protein